DGRWQITVPESWPADQDAASSLVSSLGPVSADSVVEDNATNFNTYGLNHPSLVVTVHEKGGKTQEIEFGDDVPAGSLVYARVGNQPKVYAVSSSVKSSFDKTANDLRDKRLLTFDSNKVTRIELVDGKSDIEFGKNNQNDWQILKPQPYRPDNFQVEELLRKLSDAKKVDAAYASGQPAGVAKVTDAAGTQTLDIRKNKDDYYAKSSVVKGDYKITA